MPAPTDPAAYGDAFADVYDDWYADVSDVAAAVEHLAALARGRPVLELGVGTGRVAIPLAARGVEVHGVDASSAMLDRLAARPGGGAVRTWRGDMAELALDGAPRFGVVFAAFNTLFNLASSAAQARCLARCAALLAPGGSVVVEAVVPADLRPSSDALDIARAEPGRLVVQVSRVEPDQVVAGRHVELRAGRVAVRPWRVRVTHPHELDDMAHRAGLVLDARDEDWEGTPFTDDSPVHVSRWRRSNVDVVPDAGGRRHTTPSPPAPAS